MLSKPAPDSLPARHSSSPDRRELGLLDSASSMIAVSGRLAAGARGMRERPVLLDFRPFGISC
jgi:hypothetical protein